MQRADRAECSGIGVRPAAGLGPAAAGNRPSDGAVVGGRPSVSETVFRPLADEAGRLLIDLADPEADVEALTFALDLDRHPHARDLAWFGIGRWRELVAQFFDPPGCVDSFRRIRSVEIAAETATGGVARVSVWLAAWLAGQLGWKPVERFDRLLVGSRPDLRGRGCGFCCDSGDRPIGGDVRGSGRPIEAARRDGGG